jgi:hypothetical protein
MSESIAYTVGRMHGLRGIPAHPHLFPTGTWEAVQYRQGYIDGAVVLENDIVCEKTLLNVKKR